MAARIESPRWSAILSGIFNGSLGVDLFFALSGFLITYLAVQEAHTSGGFRLRAFWVRRFFRIVPLAWTYAALFLAAALAGWRNAPLPPRDVIAGSFLFYLNYMLGLGRVPWLLGHLWTLAIEMQFYFLWAVVLKLARPRFLPAIALTGIFLVILCRLTAGLTGFGLDPFRLEARGDSLLWGALFGSILAADAGRRWLEAWIRPWGFLPLLLLLGFVADRHPFGFATFQPLLCALLITTTVLHSARTGFCWMENDALRFLGRISFSIYIWQEVFTGAESLDPHALWAALLLPPLGLLWIIPIACVSYRYIELPGMRLGYALARRDRGAV